MSDGYFNSRVAKYDKNGRFIKSVGVRGTEPYQFNMPHSITADANGNIYVADRNNRRIQVFDSNLVLRAIYDNVGAPWAVCISPGPHQYLFSSNSNPDNNNSLLAAVSGEIYKMELDGTVIGKFGKPGKQLGEFSTVHAIDCRNPDELIVVEITAWRAQKIRLKPITPSSTTVGSRGEGAAYDTCIDARDARGCSSRQCPPRRSSRSPRSPTTPSIRSSCPTTCIWAKRSAWRPTPRATSSSTRGPAIPPPRSARAARSRAARRACSSSIRPASSSARSGRDSTASSSPTRCGSIDRTTSGSWTKARTWSSSSIPKAAS